MNKGIESERKELNNGRTKNGQIDCNIILLMNHHDHENQDFFPLVSTPFYSLFYSLLFFFYLSSELSAVIHVIPLLSKIYCVFLEAFFSCSNCSSFVGLL
jgi:hypothetical protein